MKNEFFQKNVLEGVKFSFQSLRKLQKILTNFFKTLVRKPITYSLLVSVNFSKTTS
jgi:hypothetical protein